MSHLGMYFFHFSKTCVDFSKESVTQVATITGGKLDYIIANAALVSAWSGYDALGTL